MNIANASQAVLFAWATVVVVAILCELLCRSFPPERRKAIRTGLLIGPVGVYTTGAAFLTIYAVKHLFF